MKLLIKLTLNFFIISFIYTLCESHELKISDECKIPNQNRTRGMCMRRRDCNAYEDLFNVTDLGVERLSFILKLDCGFDYNSWSALVCCPKIGNSYKKPDLEVDPENVKMRETGEEESSTNSNGETVLDNRFGESNKLQKCGTQTLYDRIVGGEISHEFPWTAVLLYESKTVPNVTLNACGGALIHRRYVLTAGHCVKGETLEKAVILKYARLGEFDLTTEKDCVAAEDGELDCAPVPVDYVISEIIPHPSYDPKNPSKYHDIALLRLNENVRYNDFVSPICLPTKGFNVGYTPGFVHTVCGWGKTDHFKAKYGSKLVQSPIKLKVSIPYTDKTNCTKKYAQGNIKLSPSQICAGGVKAKDSCSGDSGSPLMFFDNKKLQWVLTGIVSFGQKQCGMEGFPAVYVNVTNYLPWIENTISNHDDDDEETIKFS